MQTQSPKIPTGFNRLAWSNLAAQSAEQIALAAAPLIAVLSFGAGAGETGILQTLQTLPFLILAIPAGLLADRMPRRHLMVFGELLRILALSAIIGFAYLQLLSWPILAMLGFVAACGTVAYSVATPALVPSLVPSQLLSAANARIELARTVAFTAGPALGGLFVGWAGAMAAFGIAAILSAVATMLLAGLIEPPQALRTRRGPLQEISEGCAFVFRHALLKPVFQTQLIFNASYFMLMAAFVPYGVRSLGLSATGIGATLAIYGVGMIVGVGLSAHVMARLSFGAVIALGPCSGLIGSILILLTIWLPLIPLAAAGFFLLGIGPIIWVISTTTLRQTITPPALLGRVSAINILAYGARPIGAGLGALIGGIYGAELCLAASSCGFLIQATLIMRSPVRKLRRLPGMPATQSAYG